MVLLVFWSVGCLHSLEICCWYSSELITLIYDKILVKGTAYRFLLCKPFFIHITHPYKPLQINWFLFTFVYRWCKMYSHPNKNKNKSQPNGRNSGLCNLTEVNRPRFHLYYIKFPAKLCRSTYGWCSTKDWSGTKALWVALMLLKFLVTHITIF